MCFPMNFVQVSKNLPETASVTSLFTKIISVISSRERRFNLPSKDLTKTAFFVLRAEKVYKKKF